MPYNFRKYDDKQTYLLPPSIQDWVSEDSLAHFISDVIDELDQQGKLTSFYARYREDGWGNAAYHPCMMVKILVYGYCVGVTSSRKLAHGLENDVSLRYLSANTQPDFRTISDFRKNHLEALSGLFVEVLRLCREAGLAKMGRVALDGTKVKGNASLAENRQQDAIAAEVERLLTKAEQLDAEEDHQFGQDRRGDELPPGLRRSEDRLRRLREAQARLEEKARRAKEGQAQKIEQREAEERASGKKKRGRKPKTPEAAVDAEAKANLTDPDSRILKTRQGYVQGYNGQAMADCASQVIVSCEVTQEENDVKQLWPMLRQCKEQAGAAPQELLADAGYWSEENVRVETEETELFIATTKDWKQRQKLREQSSPRGRIPRDASVRDLMERKLLTKRGRAAYKQRGSTIEPVFGQMGTRGLREFLLRGLDKVRTEWSLWCTTHNLLKLWRSGWQPASMGV
jgi:transposase